MPSRSTVARACLVAASAVHMVAYLYAQSEHVVDATWPSHARFHTLQALVWIEGLDLVNLLVALRSDIVNQRWSRWVLLVGGIVAHGAYFVALAAMPAGSPPEGARAHLPLAAIAAIYAVGLVLAFRSRR